MTPLHLVWLGGAHDVALPLGPLRALQQARKSGPEQLLYRLRFLEWEIDDAIQTIRWGLVGGGMDSASAADLVTSIADLHPHIPLKLAAVAVLSHALYGPEDDPVGEPQGATTPAPDLGASPASTATAP